MADVTADTRLSPPLLRARVTKYIFLRLLLVFGLFSLAAYVLIREPAAMLSLNRLFLLAGLSFLFMGVSAAWVRGVQDLRGFVFVQLLFDTALITTLVQLTGGPRSIYFVFYFMNIGAAAFLASRAAALVLAVVNSLALVGASVVHFVFLHPGALTVGASLSLYVDVLLKVFGFMILGLLTSQLAARTQQADDALQRQQETTRALEEEHGLLVQSVLSGILTVDEQGIIQSANPAALARLGTCEGRPLQAVLPGLKRYTDGQELRVNGPDEVLTLLCYRSPLGVSGGEVVVFEDVTRLRRIEAEMKREERLVGIGRIAAAIAHEIRNPLASLSGSIQLLKEEHEGPLVTIALREVLRLNDLVGEFLETARPIEPKLQPTDISEIVAEIATSFAQDPRYGELVALEVDQQGQVGLADLDPGRIRQVLWNLLLNAAQAMPDGGTVSLVVRDTPGALKVQVRDRGTGISHEDLQKVFDPFYTTRQGGTGLGLANVDKLVRAHGGRVEVRSRIGEGTTFELSFPRRTATRDLARANME